VACRGSLVVAYQDRPDQIQAYQEEGPYREEGPRMALVAVRCWGVAYRRLVASFPFLFLRAFLVQDLG